MAARREEIASIMEFEAPPSTTQIRRSSAFSDTRFYAAKEWENGTGMLFSVYDTGLTAARRTQARLRVLLTEIPNLQLVELSYSKARPSAVEIYDMQRGGLSEAKYERACATVVAVLDYFNELKEEE
jgi:hypothetical protein